MITSERVATVNDFPTVGVYPGFNGQGKRRYDGVKSGNSSGGKMTACAAQVFSGIAPDRFDCLIKESAASGITIDGNQGQTVIKHGLVSAQISWNLDAGTQTLIIQYLNPSFLAPCDKVNGMLHDLADSCP